MGSAVAGDVGVTWLGAVGCAIYIQYVWNYRGSGATGRMTLLLLGLLFALLGLRGFFWLWPTPLFGQLVFAAATLLPIAITLFCEQILRRHSPLWLKLTALGVSGGFFLANLFANLAFNRKLLVTFLIGLTVVVIANGWLLWRRDTQLSRNERSLARALAVGGALAIPLTITDFRDELTWIPVRLGGLGVLTFLYLLLSLADYGALAWRALSRIGLIILFALLLACVFAFVSAEAPERFATKALTNLPVSAAWSLVTALVLQVRELTAQGSRNVFLRWLVHAPLESRAAFLDSLRELRQTSDHLILGEAELAPYNLQELFAVHADSDQPVVLREARALARDGDGAVAAASEQLIDLLERYEMTHAMLISSVPPVVVLLNLPQGASAAVGQLRASIIQRLARRL